MSRFIPQHFINHIHLFMQSHELSDPAKENIVAVSGGVDSMVLMDVLASIFKGKLRVLHINHGTRPENVEEEKLVLSHAHKLGLEVDVVAFSMNLESSNFEALARNLRAQVFKQYIEKNYLVYTAHHLDDSFEWSMIQSFKQSSLQSTLGIPVFNKGLVRPLMCVSKKHIERYAHAKKMTWAFDSSNRDHRFERNFFRSKLTATISSRYPQYLRHYVARQNILALKLNMHRSLFLKRPKELMSRLHERREMSGAIVLAARDFLLHKEQIKEWIHFFSKNHRGEIDREVDKLIQAHKLTVEDPKEPKMKGPLSFSGGVKIYILKQYLLITNELHMHFYKNCDDVMVEYLEKSGSAQIYAMAQKNAHKYFFPYLCVLSEKDKAKSSKLKHPLLPKTCDWLKKNKIPYSFYPLIHTKGRQKLIHNAVILDSSVLGL